MTSTQVVCDRGGAPIEIGGQVSMLLPGRPRHVVLGTVRAVNRDSVEIWEGDENMQMFHSASPDQVRVII
jgi:hypothetical protein